MYVDTIHGRVERRSSRSSENVYKNFISHQRHTVFRFIFCITSGVFTRKYIPYSKNIRNQLSEDKDEKI